MDLHDINDIAEILAIDHLDYLHTFQFTPAENYKPRIGPLAIWRKRKK